MGRCGEPYSPISRLLKTSAQIWRKINMAKIIINTIDIGCTTYLDFSLESCKADLWPWWRILSISFDLIMKALSQMKPQNAYMCFCLEIVNLSCKKIDKAVGVLSWPKYLGYFLKNVWRLARSKLYLRCIFVQVLIETCNHLHETGRCWRNVCNFAWKEDRTLSVMRNILY